MKRPPLTREDLIAIRDRNRGQGDVVTLLWEVRRLRALVLRSHDYFRQQSTSSTAQMLASAMLRVLDEEPVVKEQPKL